MAIAEGLRGFAGRGPCTDAERRAANWLHDELRSDGHEAWVETLWLRPQWALSLALHATLGVVASLVAVRAPLPALIAAGVTALSLAIEATGRAGPLRWILPRRATQNVLVAAEDGHAERGHAELAHAERGHDERRHAELAHAERRHAERGHAERRHAERGHVAPDDAADADGRSVTLLICAHYDAPRSGLVTRDRPRRLAARVRRALGGRAPSPRAWLALACAAVAGCAGARLAGGEGLAIGIAQFVPTVVLLGALAAAADVAVAGIGPGAGDNATGVGVAVALHDELTRSPPANLSPALLLFGAGEGGPAALRAHVRREKLDPRTTVVLELGPCGAGEPAYAAAHSQVRAACASAGEVAADVNRRAPLRASTGAGAARWRRLPAAWVGCLDETGIIPRSRQADDTFDRVEPASVEAALAYALACADELAAAIAA